MVTNKLKLIGFVTIVFLVTFVFAMIIPNDVQNSEKPLMVKGYEIVDLNIGEDVFELTMKDKDGNEYLVQYLAEDLEDLVCHKGMYEFTNVVREYDCSTPEKMVNAMIEELVIQTDEIIEQDGAE